MSRENVEFIKRGYRVLSTRDLDAALPLVAEGFVFESLWARTYHGHAGLREWSSEMREVFEDYELRLEDVVDVGDGRVLAVLEVSGKGESSGAPVRQEVATVWTIEGGKAVRAVSYPSRAEALEAVGLPDRRPRRGESDPGSAPSAPH